MRKEKYKLVRKEAKVRRLYPSIPIGNGGGGVKYRGRKIHLYACILYLCIDYS
jgi:hypothetical protein